MLCLIYRAPDWPDGAAETVTALVGQWAAHSSQYQHSSSYMYALSVSGWMASEPSRQMWSAAP
jgi:hypothetical protein